MGTGKPDVVTYGEYATRLKKSIEAAYLRVRENVSKKHECQKQFYDRKCHGDPFEEGNLVWLHSPVVPRGKIQEISPPMDRALENHRTVVRRYISYTRLQSKAPASGGAF